MTSNRKGIILAGGSGTRLYPVTKVISKQLLPIYDKPMIYYSLSILMLADIRDILLISTPNDIPLFQSLLGDGSKWGINIEYKIQPSPDGLAQAFILGEKFIDNHRSALVLGDNIFYGHNLVDLISSANAQKKGATIFGYRVNDPERYGVVEIGDNKKVLSLEEKPSSPKSNYAAVGLYFYDENVCNYCKNLKPSERGELEITDLNGVYLNEGQLNVEIMDRGYAWLDTGTYESLIDAGQFVQTIEKRQGLKIACLEEIAINKGWKSYEKIIDSLDNKNSDYSKYVINLAK
tara:strand:- start:1346 stop:2218 length:873 start_codon:yes stop_codon:yes gene_type:complete